MSEIDLLIEWVKRYDITGEEHIKKELDELIHNYKVREKLQELVKKRLRKLNAYKFDKTDDDLFELSMRDSIETDIHTLQSLVDESEQ